MVQNLRFTSPDKKHVAFDLPNGGGSMSVGEFQKQHPSEALPAGYVDPRTPQQIYDEEVLAQLDAQVLKDAARMVEDFYDALVDQLPQSMKDKHGPLMAERKAKRAARP